MEIIAIQSEFFLKQKAVNESRIISYLDEFDIYDFGPVANEAMRITNLEERIEFLIKEKGNKELFSLHYDEDSYVMDLCKEFIQKCNQAIDITERQLNYCTGLSTDSNELATEKTPEHSVATDTNESVLSKEETESKLPESIKNKDFTTARQVLAIYYLLNEIDHKGINQIDKTVKARFIEFLTGRDYSNIYKAISNPLKGLSNQNSKAAKKDMEYVAGHFQKLGMQSIVEQINRDLKSDE